MNYFLNFCQYREMTDISSSVAVKSRVDHFFWRTCFNETQISTNPDALCYLTGWSNGVFWLRRLWLRESTSKEDTGFSTNLERQLPVLLMLGDDIQGKRWSFHAPVPVGWGIAAGGGKIPWYTNCVCPVGSVMVSKAVSLLQTLRLLAETFFIRPSRVFGKSRQVFGCMSFS